MIIGFDISSVKIGISILSLDGKILKLDVLKLSSKLSLLERAMVFKKYCEDNLLYCVTKDFRVIIESPFISVGGGFGRASTTATLQRFNGIISFIAYEVFGIVPEMVNVNHVRSSLGIKMPRGLDQKAKKQIVIDWAIRKFESDPKIEILRKQTKFWNAATGVDDMADALIIAYFGCKNAD